MKFTFDDTLRESRKTRRWYSPEDCQKTECRYPKPEGHYIAFTKHNEPFIVRWFYPSDGGNPGWLVLDRDGFTMFNSSDLLMMASIWTPVEKN